MAGRRNERIEFPYAGQPGMAPHQQQHPAPVQPSMNVPQPQQPPSGPGSQQQTPTPTPQPSRQRNKRPAPGTVPSPATPAAIPAVAAGQPPVPTPPNAQSAAPPAAPAPADDSGTAPSQPPAKKSRTNTPWTPGEELRLKQMRDAGNSWAEIAKTFPTRTEGSVKKHWYKDMHYAEFAEDESQALLNAIKEYENNKWKVIGQKVGKPAKACEQYAKEHFPDLFASTKR
ncbi:MYB DNA-binding domain protein [Akanthomyces lecanii RCEF 1005]|uniref:MYB DNA-binding domain protein n=1 Tax=Akanthomyces lecanii RCEF 1005 TaxID=1081108 RepID=A0A162K929_CORDF|nr:MYB DNA-binding domain protein [Akanthomyces lecanii RCEF 1005]